MKVYAILCEHHSAGVAYEGVEKICKTYKIAESHFLNGEFLGHPCRIREMAFTDKMWTRPKPKKKKKKTKK